MRDISTTMVVAVWLIGVVAAASFWGLVAWAIYRLVMHFTS